MTQADSPVRLGDAETTERLSAGRLAELACLLEVTARKPGNVHRFADLPGLHFVDFLMSASRDCGPARPSRFRRHRCYRAPVPFKRPALCRQHQHQSGHRAVAGTFGGGSRRDQSCRGRGEGSRLDDGHGREPGLSRDQARTARWNGRSGRRGHQSRADAVTPRRDGSGCFSRYDRASIRERVSGSAA